MELKYLCALFVSNIAHPQNRSHATASIAGVLKGGSGAIVAVHLEPATEDPLRYYDGYEAGRHLESVQGLQNNIAQIRHAAIVCTCKLRKLDRKKRPSRSSL